MFQRILCVTFYITMDLFFGMQICQTQKYLSKNDCNVSFGNKVWFHHIGTTCSTAIFHHNPELRAFDIGTKVPFCGKSRVFLGETNRVTYLLFIWAKMAISFMISSTSSSA